MDMVVAVLLVLVAGVATAVEAPTNALMVKNVASVSFTTFVVMGLGALVAGVSFLILRPQLQPNWATTTPWYAFVGGLYGVAIVAATAWATPKLGAGAALVILVAAQVLVGVGLDHFAALGLEKHPASWLRLAGCLVVIGGALMVSLG